MSKHAAIYPSEDELQSIQKIVSITERALKLVSDIITDQENEKEEDKEKKEAVKDRWGSGSTGSKILLFEWATDLRPLGPELLLDNKCFLVFVRLNHL